MIQYAREIVKQWEGKMAKLGRAIIFIGPVVSALFLIDAIVSKDWTSAVIWILIGALYVFMVRRLPQIWRKNVAKAKTAEASAQKLLDSRPATPTQ